MSSQTQEGRRGGSRYLAGLAATLHYRDQDFPCEAANLSRSGVLVTGPMPPPDDPEVELTLESSGGDLRVRMRVSVAHVAPGDETGVATLGLQFEGLDAAQKRGLSALLARVVEGIAPAPIKALGAHARPAEIRKALDKMPLAHRVMLAARAQATERGHLKYDPNPQVLEGLARNPGVNLQELKNIIRMNQILPSTLELVANDSRWKADDELKIMVATHPRVPLKVAEQVVSTMNERAIAKVLERSGLHPDLREKLLNPLQRRRLMRSR